jgi:hypothetical protein
VGVLWGDGWILVMEITNSIFFYFIGCYMGDLYYLSIYLFIKILMILIIKYKVIG